MTKHYTKADLEAAYMFGKCKHSWSTFEEWFGQWNGGQFAVLQCDKEIPAKWIPISGENWEIVSAESPGDPTETKSYDCHGMYNDSIQGRVFDGSHHFILTLDGDRVHASDCGCGEEIDDE